MFQKWGLDIKKSAANSVNNVVDKGESGELLKGDL
jgi:hypothetical protein